MAKNLANKSFRDLSLASSLDARPQGVVGERVSTVDLEEDAGRESFEG
jgi:hypothetical protein